MILTVLFTIVFLAFNFFSAENLVPTIIGSLVSIGVTQFLKSKSGIGGVAATLLAFVISFVVAIVAFVAATYFSGGQLNYEMIPQGALQIFALATLAYKTLIADIVASEKS